MPLRVISTTPLVDPSNPPVMSYVSGTSLAVSTGECVVGDGTSRRAWINTAPITKTLSSWAAGSGVGGRLKPSAFALSETVFVFALMNGSGLIEVGFDDNVNCTNQPSGYKWFKLIGAFQLLTSGSAIFQQFSMDKQRWVTANFQKEIFIAGASWASKLIPGCPMGDIQVFGIVGAGLPVDGGSYAIRVTTTNPVASGLAAPQNATHSDATFDGNVSSYLTSVGGLSYFSPRLNTDKFVGVASSGLLWYYKTGSAYIGVGNTSTFRLEGYRVA